MSKKYERPDGRSYDAMRPIEITVGVSKFAEGSCEIRFGDTEVLCLATVTDSVPRHLIGKDEGWVTAEYAMLPRSAVQADVRWRSSAWSDVRCDRPSISRPSALAA